MAEPSIVVKVEDGELGRVATVTVDNQKKLNTLNTARIVALREVFVRLARDAELRVVVLTGAGERAFIGGADLDELGGLCAESSRLFITRLHKACKAIRECPVPVIGRISGYCLGAGLEVAASCDMRICSTDASFGMPEVQVGLPSVVEAALLPGLIGWGKTREILLTGEMFGAADAFQMGFVQKLVARAELDAGVAHWRDLICRAGPQAIRNQKALMNRWEQVSVQEGIYASIDALSDAYKTGEPQAAVKAFFERKGRKDR